jgi:ATP-binding cassette, subfamily B, beta-glucan exporter
MDGACAQPIAFKYGSIGGIRAHKNMNFLRLYVRVLKQLGPDSRLGVFLALANVALALALFAEPVLFGRVINILALAQVTPETTQWPKLWLLLAAWVAFGFFTIACGTLVALYADRLAHRRRQAVLTNYFEHALQLPLAFHGEVHSGRLMKIMLQGADALWALWLGFFRDHMAAFVSLVILAPLAVFINWRLAILLIVLCLLFGILTVAVIRKTESLQNAVKRHSSDLAERVTDALGNVALVQSFARIESEVTAVRSVSERLLAAQFPVLSWWAVVAVLARAATTLTVLSIILLGTWLFQHGRVTIGEIVTFMALAGMVIARIEQSVGFANRMAVDAARLREFFGVLDTVPPQLDRPDAIDPGRLTGQVEFQAVSFSYDGGVPAVIDLNFIAQPGEIVALVGATGAGKSTALALLHRAFDPQSGIIKIDGLDIRGLKFAALRRNIGVVFQESLLFNRSIAENLLVGKPDASVEQMRDAAARARALDFIEYKVEGFDAKVGERGRSLSGGER